MSKTQFFPVSIVNIHIFLKKHLEKTMFKGLCVNYGCLLEVFYLKKIKLIESRSLLLKQALLPGKFVKPNKPEHSSYYFSLDLLFPNLKDSTTKMFS